MNAADTLLARGFSSLRSVAGETLTIGASSVSAVVNRTPGADANRNPGVPDFSLRSTSRIEVEFSQLNARPKAGAVFTDEAGSKHRVKSVETNGMAWVCECEVSS